MKTKLSIFKDLDNSEKAVAAMVSLLLIGTGMAVLVSDDAGPAPGEESITVAWPDYGPNLVMWPIENDKVSVEGVEVDPKKVSEGQQTKLLFSGKVDMATTDIAGIKRLYNQGEMDDFVIIGGYYIEKAVNGSSIGNVYAQADSNITEPEDFKGKTLALGEPGSTSNLLFKEVMSEKYGVEPGEYEVLHKPEGASALLEQGDVDGALVWSQFVVNDEFNGKNRKVVDFGADFKELYGEMPSNGVVVASKEAVEENPEKYRKAMTLFKKSHDWSRNNLEMIADEWSERGYLDLDKEDWLEVKQYNAHWHPLTEERIKANEKVWGLMNKYGESEGESPEFSELHRDLGYLEDESQG